MNRAGMGGGPGGRPGGPHGGPRHGHMDPHHRMPPENLAGAVSPAPFASAFRGPSMMNRPEAVPMMDHNIGFAGPIHHSPGHPYPGRHETRRKPPRDFRWGSAHMDMRHFEECLRILRNARMSGYKLLYPEEMILRRYLGRVPYGPTEIDDLIHWLEEEIRYF